jgi:hypothetical protein
MSVVDVKFRSTWRGPTFRRKVRAGMGRNLALAARYTRDEIRRRISVQGSYVPANHSAPGDYPYRQSGKLIRSYRFAVDRQRLFAWIGTELVYGRYLEQGTRIMKPRPHVRRTIYGNPVIAGLMCARITI